MSRNYGRGYHRRATPVCQTSFTIDKLFKENSNRPCAARSAGTIGKWGITSFTTIRSSGFENTTTSKYSVGISQNRVKQKEAAVPAETKVKDEAPKPKKFFKSRNNDTAEKTQTTPGNRSSVKKTPKKLVEDVNAQKPLVSKNISNSDEHKPPIVLRIIKGTTCIISDGESHMSPPSSNSATPPSPRQRSSPKQSEAVLTRSSRRRSTQDSADSIAVSLSPRPKRARREVIKDPEIQSIISQLISDDEGEGVFEACALKLEVASDEETESKSLERIKRELQANAPGDDTSEDSIPLASTEYYLKKEGNANKENEDITVKEEVPEPELKEPEMSETDVEKLIEAQQLLAETSIDFSATINKILSPPPKLERDEPEQEPEVLPENQPEFDSESDSQEGNSVSGTSTCTLMSSVDKGGGLKLVIKKTDTDKEVKEEKCDELNPPEKNSPIKKKSIFKSRAKEDGGAISKRLAVYKHNWNSSQAPDATNKEIPVASKSAAYDLNEFELGALTRITAETSAQNGQPPEDVTKVICDKKDKDYYTVIRNVKKAHQIQESGEFQEFNDDVEYILDALRDNNPVGTRCLSAITLAGKCMAPAFRMHVRAHGTVAKFFKALHDATTDPSLGLCTATVMFVLSQDRLNMDLDRDSLELMLNLLESDASHKNALNDCGMTSAQLRKNKQKVRELCAEIKGSGSAKHLNLDNITEKM